MSNLYQLTNDFTALQGMLEDGDDVSQEAIQTTITGLATDLKDAVEWSVKLIKNIESDVSALDSEIERLTARKKRAEARIKSVRDAIKSCMQAANETSIKTPLFSVSLASGRESVAVLDESAIPDECMTVKTTISPDKKLIAEKFKAGESVPGCELVRGESSIRIK